MQFGGRDLLDMSDADRRKLIGKDVAMIFQEPTTSLNPCFTIGFQLTETLRLHLGMDRNAARNRAVELLEQVGIPAAASRLKDFPHQMSGGMNQRVMIAMAIACNPKLLIADEPTTALDVRSRRRSSTCCALQQDRGMALVLVTHNMGVVAEMARRVAVMYAGQIVEERGAEALFASPQHPYTAALLAAMPERSTGDGRLATIPGVVPGLYDRPQGCLFAPRCTYATAQSCQTRPETRPWFDGQVRCHFPLGDPQRDAAIARERQIEAEAPA
jgi:dipeptide transport system ATP-binding protein